MKAFRNVVAAQGGVSEIARRAAVDRVGLSRGLSGSRDPRLGTVTKIAAACGVKLQFVALDQIAVFSRLRQRRNRTTALVTCSRRDY